MRDDNSSHNGHEHYVQAYLPGMSPVASCRGGYASWIDRLPWQISSQINHRYSCSSSAIRTLTQNLDHRNSSIRNWMISIAWFLVPRLNRREAIPRLLKNVGDALSGPFLAEGLAARFFGSSEEFFAHARTHRPSLRFPAQYADRLDYAEELGLLQVQAVLWERESRCRILT